MRADTAHSLLQNVLAEEVSTVRFVAFHQNLDPDRLLCLHKPVQAQPSTSLGAPFIHVRRGADWQRATVGWSCIGSRPDSTHRKFRPVAAPANRHERRRSTSSTIFPARASGQSAGAAVIPRRLRASKIARWTGTSASFTIGWLCEALGTSSTVNPSWSARRRSASQRERWTVIVAEAVAITEISGRRLKAPLRKISIAIRQASTAGAAGARGDE